MAYPSRRWMEKARCLDEGPDWLDKPVRAQLDDCLDCPVRLHCLLYAVEIRASGVVYGGVELREGRPLKEV